MDTEMPETSSSQQYKFLAGGGEMGMLMRQKDWSKTLLGSPDKWPQSLRTTLSIILHSKFPMFLWWGPDLICFYNDAYRPSLGKNGKHPSILGEKAADAWPEIWSIIKPLIDQVLSGGEATWSEDQLIPIYRNGKVEDVYWTFSYSPVIDETGNPAGVFVTCSETTEKVLTHRKLEESKNQLQFAIDAADMATWDINPVTNKFTGNKRLKEWHGLNEDEEFDVETGFNIVVEADRAILKNAISRALEYSSGGILDIEYTIKNPVTKQTRIVRAKGRTTFGTDKSAIRLNGTLENVTDEAIARQKIEQADKRFRNTVKQAPIGITILRGPEYVVEMANDAYLELVGKKESTFVGRPLFDSLPEVEETVHSLLDNVLATGIAFNGTEYPIPLIRSGKQEVFYFNFLYHALREDDGSISGIIVTVSEVTESVKSKKFVAESEQRLRSFVEGAPFPIGIYIGKEMRIQLVNQSILDVWGKSKNIIGQKYADVLPELKGQGIFEQLDKVFTTGVAFHAHNQRVDLMAHDMEPHYFNYSFTPLFDAAGKIYGVMNTAAEVTDLVIAKQKIEVSEKDYKQLADSLPELVWTTDSEGKQTFASRRWKEFTGLDPYDETTFAKMIHPDDLQGLLKVWSNCLATGNIYKTQARLKSINGDYQWFYINGEPIKNELGKIEKWIGAFTNFNEQKKAEAELIGALLSVEESEKRLNIIIEASELGTWELNVKTREINYSDRYLQILGYSNWINMTHEQLVNHLHPDDRPIRDRAFAEAFETGFLHYEARFIWNDQSIHWVEGKGKVFYDEQGEPSTLIGTLRDITEEKYYQQELEDREQKFRLLADSMPQFVWTGDAEGSLNYFNQAVYNYSGLTPEEINKNGWLQIVHPDDHEENIKRWMQAIQTGSDFLLEHRFRRSDGEYRWQLSRAIPQRDAAGNIQMWVGSSTDIQEMKELDQQKDFFISMASHELKTPITSIKGYVQMLQSMYGKKDDTFLKNSLRVIDKQIITLTNLISDLLDLSKIKSGSLFLSKEDFEINELAREVVDEIEHVNHDYKFIFSGETEKIVHADRERIGQVLRNFLTNAVKYSPESKTVKIKCESDADEVTISVEDAGIGINKNDQEKIFERFYRVEGKNEKTFPGFGIGLFISAEIVHRHQGEIGVKSEPGKGSIFYFSLPLID